MSKKIILLILVSVFVVTMGLFSCKAEPEVIIETEEVEEKAEEVEEEAIEGEQVTLSFQSWILKDEVLKDTLAAIFDRFEKENPDIKLELLDVPFEEYLRQLIIQVSAGMAPDVIQITPAWSVQISEFGVLADLNPYFSQEELNNIPVAAYEAGVFGDKLLTVPWQIGTIIVIANKSLLEAAGLPIEIPETWTDFKEAVRKISDLGENFYGFGARTDKSTNAAFWFIPVLEGHGGHLVDSEGNVTLYSPETVAALDWYKEIGTTKQTPVGMGLREVRNIFAQGLVGFTFDGPWIRGILRGLSGKGEAADDDFIVGLMPKAPDGKRYAISNNQSLAMAEQSEVKEQAIRLIKYLTQDEEMWKLYNSIEAAIPPTKSLLADPVWADDEYAQVFIETAEYGNNIPSRNPNVNAALEFVANMMQTALLGGDTEEAAKTAHDNIKTLYGQ